MFKLFIENNFLSPNKSGFKTNDSCINQLLLSLMKYTNHLMKALKLEMFFLDISKVSDKVWHEGPIFKLKQNGISGNSLNLCDFLRNRKLRVLLNGQVSDWCNVKAGVTQSNS